MLSPKSAKLNARLKVLDKFKKVEAKIDEALTENALDEFGITTIDIEIVGNDLVPMVIAKYKKAGWKVKRVNDQRDGDFLEFKA